MEKQDILDKLSVKYPQFKFALTLPPLFLQSLLEYNSKNKIILCYKIGQRGCKKFEDGTNKLSIINQVEESCVSVLGQPLDAPFSLEESMLNLTICKSSEETINVSHVYLPLTLNETLNIKKFCNIELKNVIPVIILCDGKLKIPQSIGKLNEVQRVIHGCVQTEIDNWNTTFWTDYSRMQSTSLPTLSELCQNHFSKVYGVKGQTKEYESQLKSKSVLSCIDNIGEDPTNCCTISLQLEWNYLTIKPPIDRRTNFSLIVDTNLDCAPSVSMSIFWKQLVLLQNYLNLFENSNGIFTKDLRLPSANSLVEDLGLEKEVVSSSNIKSIVYNLLYGQNSAGNRISRLSDNEKITLAYCVDIFASTNNQLIDLTHSLWLKLVGCESYGTLQLLFMEVLKQVCSSPMARSVKRTNISRFAHHVHSGVMTSSRLFDPVEYFIEVGIEKLRQTLLAICETLRIPNLKLGIPDLPNFSELSTNEEWIKTAKCWLTWLTRLYSSLNILYCIEIALLKPSLPMFFPVINNVINSVCTPSIDSCATEISLSSVIEKPRRSFTVNISADLINSSAAINIEKFDEWSLVLISNGARKVTSIFYRSLKCPLPYLTDNDHLPNSENGSNVKLMNASTNMTVDVANMTVFSEQISYDLHCFESHFISDNFCFNSNKCV